MKMVCVCGLALLLSGAAGAQEKPRLEQLEEVMKETIQGLKDLTELLKTIKDKDTFARAKPRLEMLRNRLQSVKDKGAKLGKPTKEQDEELKKKYQQKIQDTTLHLREEYKRLKENLPEVVEYLDALDKKPPEKKPEEKKPDEKKPPKA